MTPKALSVAGLTTTYADGTRALDEPWRTLTRLDPLFYLVDATRAGVTDFHETSPWLSLAVAGIVALVAVAAAALLLERGWRLKP